MRSVNKVVLLGHLGQDPELKYTPSGQAVARLRLATSDRFKDKNGEWQDRTEWHTVTCWAKLAEIASQYLTKGSQVYFEGRLRTHSWEDKDGKKNYSTEVVAEDMVMCGGRGQGGDARRDAGDSRQSGARRAAAGEDAAPAHAPLGPPEITDDDIPF